MSRLFSRLANAASYWMGEPVSFILAVAVILLWGFAGPLMGFSDTWQLLINTGTTVLTFLMVFLIQHTQNRDAEALQRKLDELIKSVDKADNAMVGYDKEIKGE